MCSVLADSQMWTGLDLSAFDGNGNAALDSLLRVLVVVLLESLVGLVLGLIALSSWLVNLTAIAKMQLQHASSLPIADAIVQVKQDSKHYGLVWLIGLLYLIGPVLPMSALIAVSTLARMNLQAFNQPLVAIPPEFILPINLLAGILFLLVLNYCFILTVVSTTGLSAKGANDATMKVMLSSVKQVLLLDLFVLLIDVLLSCGPLLIEYLPAFQHLSRNLPYNLFAQAWLALSSIIAWPLTLLMFARLIDSELESKPEAFMNKRSNASDLARDASRKDVSQEINESADANESSLEKQ